MKALPSWRRQVMVPAPKTTTLATVPVEEGEGGGHVRCGGQLLLDWFSLPRVRACIKVALANLYRYADDALQPVPTGGNNSDGALRLRRDFRVALLSMHNPVWNKA